MPKLTKPVLLFDGGCGVCRRIAHWVEASAHSLSGEPSLIVRPVGEDPDEIRRLNPGLNIWDAYATIHLLMPNGSMRLGGEAVAEVFRRLPVTKWFAWGFDIKSFGFRPFQALLNLAYAVLDDVRPLFGCESCGAPRAWLRPFAAIIKWTQGVLGKDLVRGDVPHTTVFSVDRLRQLPVLVEPPAQNGKPII